VLALSEAVEQARPERRLTILFIATGGSFAFFATAIGALYLAELSGVPVGFNFIPFATHPYLQIFGFLAEFVIGVANSILPLFKSKRRESLALAYSSFVLITVANLVILVSILLNFSGSAFELAGALILASSIIFAYETLRILGRPSKLLGEAEPFMALSSVTFILLALTLLLQYARAQQETFSPALIYLSLFGFVGSMIYGVEHRTIAFRMTKYRKKPALAGFALQSAAVAAIFLGGVVAGYSGFFEGLGSVLFLGAAGLVIFSLKIFERRTVTLPIGSKVGNPLIVSPRTIASYSNACMISGSSWLLLACVLGALWVIQGEGSFAIRDSFIHSAAIGFIGSTIVAFGPVLLPGVLSKKAPNRNLSLWPLILLNASLILRVAGNFFPVSYGGTPSLPAWESASGILILASMALLMRSLHLGRGAG